MAFLLKQTGKLAVEAGFDSDGVISHPLPSGSIKSLLRIKVEINEIHCNLKVSLGLHITAHYAKRTNRFSVFKDKAGNNGVVGAFSGFKAVCLLRVKRNIESAVLERNAGIFYNDSGTESHIVGLYKRNHVSFPVGAAEINGAALGRN